MKTISINGIEEASGLLAITKLSYDRLPQRSQLQLFLAATARNWPIDEEIAREALKYSLVEQVTPLGEGRATVRFHASIANIIAWLNGEKPYWL